MDKPLVSVGIPTYNRPEGLRSVLTDICNQTYQNLEIIISDNASPHPEVKLILEEFKLRDSRIRFFIQSENKGSTFNFQFVLEKATGEYFMWAADDDSFSNEFIHKCIILFSKNPNCILSTTACRVNDNHNSKTRISSNFQTTGLKALERVKFTITHTLGSNEMFYSLYIRRYLLLWTFPKYFGSDVSMLIFLSQYGEFSVDTCYIGYTYNLNPGSVSSNLDYYKSEVGFTSKFKKHFFISISVFKMLINILQLYEISIFFRINLVIYYIYCLRGNYRYTFIKDETSSFIRVLFRKVKVCFNVLRTRLVL